MKRTEKPAPRQTAHGQEPSQRGTTGSNRLPGVRTARKGKSLPGSGKSDDSLIQTDGRESSPWERGTLGPGLSGRGHARAGMEANRPHHGAGTTDGRKSS